MGGHRNTRRRYSRLRAIGAGFALISLAVSLDACGEGSSSSANETSGTYRVKVLKAEFPTHQRLGQTSLLRIGIRNTGKKTAPATAVTISIAGREGQTSSLPFGVHDPQPELAQHDRPVWVLAEGSPRIAGTSSPTVGGMSAPFRDPFLVRTCPNRPLSRSLSLASMSARRCSNGDGFERVAASSLSGIGSGGMPRSA